MVFVSPASDAPRIGALVHPGDAQASLRHGFRVAVVRRTEKVSDEQLVFVEILA